MDNLSVLDPLAWDPEAIKEHPAYHAGNALGWLYRGDKQAATNYPLAGRLYLSKSGWLLLAVPNALVRGVFDAISAPGAELPTAGVMNVPNVEEDLVNAHISVMNADEVASIGADKINERGHTFHYTLGALKEIPVSNVDGVSRIWAIQISSPALTALRKSYGLSPLLKDHAFHITVAVRRKRVLHANAVSKAAGDNSETTYDCGCAGPCMCPSTCVCKRYGRCSATKQSADSAQTEDLLSGGEADHASDNQFAKSDLAEGRKHEREHTDNNQIAEEIAKDHLSEDPAYYKKVEQIEKDSSAPIAKRLRLAKEHSDKKRYGHKNQMLREMMTEKPDDWEIDDDKPKFKGVTHRPTKFRFHMDPTAIPGTVKKATGNSVYARQFQNLLNFRQPIAYDHSKPVFQNVVDHLMQAKERGDWLLSANQRQHLYRTQLDPQYRAQMARAAFEGTLPRMNTTDRVMQLYGNDIFDTIRNFAGKKT